MRALLLKDTHQFEIIEMDKPVPEKGQALVKVLSAAICGSEVHGYHGKHFGRKAPAVMGHETCGIVAALGPDTEGPAVGTRVVALPQWSCNECYWCRHGFPNRCNKRVMLGFTKWPGAYGEYFVIPARLLYPIADVYTDQQATLIEPFAVGLHGVRRSGVKMGDSVLVLGSGAIGLMTVLAAKCSGATTIIATDVLDYNLEQAKKVGATHTFNSRNGSVVELVNSLTNGMGVDHTLLAASAPGVMDEAIGATRRGGYIVDIASYTSAIPFNIEAMQLKEQALLGSVTYDEEDFRIAISLAESVHPLVAGLITHDFPIEKAAEAFELVDKRKENLVRVTFTMPK